MSDTDTFDIEQHRIALIDESAQPPPPGPGPQVNMN